MKEITRISKLAFVLNVSVNTLIQELKKFSSRAIDKNSKLDFKEIQFLTEKYQIDKALKKEVERKKSRFFFDIDEGFSFTSTEKKELPELLSQYVKNQKDITELKRKEKRFWALEAEEIKLLLKSKFQRLHEIQKEVKEERKAKEEREFIAATKSNESKRDPYENFQWGGLSGEEAHTAYWNCD